MFVHSTDTRLVLRALAVPLLALTLGLAACTTQSSGCTGSAMDYSGSTTGAPSARTALTAYLAHASKGLPKDGWRVSSRRPNLTEFQSGTARLEVSRFPRGWDVTGYRTC